MKKRRQQNATEPACPDDAGSIGEQSVIEYAASFPLKEQVVREISAAQTNPYHWEMWARPKQLIPAGDTWVVWLILAGRGFGKTRTGAETVRIVATSGKVERIAIVGDTVADVRNVMVDGPDGILKRSPPAERPQYEASKRRLTWPNGVVAITYSGVDPEQLRGPQHGFAWVDELAKIKYAREMWDNLMMGLRMGAHPRCLVTTTPRPISLLRELVLRENRDIVVTRGTSYENLGNLAPTFRKNILERYEGTTIGRQELHAELLDEMPGALWKRKDLDAYRRPLAGTLVRIGVGVDPSVSGTGEGDVCGIVVAGMDDQSPPHAYVLEDVSLRGSPGEWADRVVQVYHRYAANLVVAEGNQGGALVGEVIHAIDRTVPVSVVYARHGKAARAEPVVALYEQGRVHHVGSLPQLEDEMVLWLPGMPSPNRLDAAVWILTELLVKGGSEIDAEII